MITPEIHVIIGPMFSQKTTELIRRGIVYHSIGVKVLYINHAFDVRTSEGKDFSTHNSTITEIPFDSLKVSNLSECDVKDAAVILIDEAQFFSNLTDTVRKWCEIDRKIVILAGLDGNFKREPFGEILNIIPLANTVTKLASVCISCVGKGKITDALFSKKLGNNGNIIDIGASEKYIPVCRECYI